MANASRALAVAGVATTSVPYALLNVYAALASAIRTLTILNGFLPAAVMAFAVEVDQDFARLGTFALADNAAIFQLVHDARGAAVAEAQATLQQ